MQVFCGFVRQPKVSQPPLHTWSQPPPLSLSQPFWHQPSHAQLQTAAPQPASHVTPPLPKNSARRARRRSFGSAAPKAGAASRRRTGVRSGARCLACSGPAAAVVGGGGGACAHTLAATAAATSHGARCCVRMLLLHMVRLCCVCPRAPSGCQWMQALQSGQSLHSTSAALISQMTHFPINWPKCTVLE